MKPNYPLVLVITVVSVLLLLATPTIAQSATNGSISGKVSGPSNISLAEVKVLLLNASNTTEAIDNVTSQIDTNGFYQFTNVPNGSYKVFAYGPFFASGMSSNVTVVSNDTYTANVVIIPEPYYADMSATETAIPLESGKTAITVTVYDFWNNKVGSGWFLSFYSTAGSLNPTYGYTDSNSQLKTVLNAPAEGNYTVVTVHAQAKNGTYYPLQERVVNVTATATPVATPTATPAANATVTPTAGPTATTEPTAAPTTQPTAEPTAAPTTVPTPGFEALAAILGIALVVASKKMN